MRKTKRFLARLGLWRDERGQDMVEYAMIAAFIAVVSGVFFPNVSQDVSTIYSKIASTMTGTSSTS